MITDYSKQVDLIKPHEFTERINIVGCGAIGSWLAFFLLKMGFGNIHVYDFDTIEEHNIPNQLFKESDIFSAKVDALLNIYNEHFNDDTQRLKVHKTEITQDNAHVLSGVVFGCVDSMAARKYIYENCYKHGHAKFFCEGRLSIWGSYIYTLYKNGEDWTKKYENTLYADSEAEVSACGVSQTGLPAAVNCASMMIMQLIRWHREESPLHKIEYSIPELISMTE